MSRGPTQVIRHLSSRGNNAWFLFAIADALQLLNLGKSASWADLKRACTPKAVRQIHEAMVDLWPDVNDLERILEAEKENTTAL